MSEFAKNSDEIVEVTDENICAGFSACPEGDQMPMTAAYFNGAFQWFTDKLEALQNSLAALQTCFDQLTIQNMGTGLGLCPASSVFGNNDRYPYKTSIYRIFCNPAFYAASSTSSYSTSMMSGSGGGRPTPSSRRFAILNISATSGWTLCSTTDVSTRP